MRAMTKKKSKRARKTAKARLRLQQKTLQSHPKIPSMGTAMFSSWWKRMIFGHKLAAASIAIGLLSLVPAALGMRQTVTVSVATPMAMSNPLTAPFLIKNDGPFEMTDIRVRCYSQMLSAKGVSMGGNIFPPRGNPMDESKTLRRGETKPVICLPPFETEERINGADIVLIVDHTKLWFIHSRDMFRFAGAPSDTGLRWHQFPLDSIRESVEKQLYEFKVREDLNADL
jgi:hypothetical protein